MSFIRIDNIHKSYGSLAVLKGISLEVDPGEVLAIIGKSGSGKSTLLRCINGLEAIDGGSISVDGVTLTRDYEHLRQVRMKVGMIFQQFNLYPHLTVGKNLMLSPRLVKGASQAEAAAAARHILERVGLEDKYDAYPDQLSGGQQQRVAIARALCMGPKALLCDEITSALDPELVGEVLSVIKSLATEGMTLLIVTHLMWYAKEVCDRVVFMHNGLIHESGTPDCIFTDPQTPELRSFLGLNREGMGAAG
jgi:polar amino acid transport system ATP-binding protein